MTERGVFHEAIHNDEIKRFCQSVQTLEVTRMRSPTAELDTPSYDDL